MFLQTILGVWPVELLEQDDAPVLATLRDRLAVFVPKALREGKRHSKWIEPNAAYETATIDLIKRLLKDGSPFITRLRPIMRDLALRGMLVSLGRTVLKCTVPGVPDFYQSTALWDFSLVDPDNRRPVDYVERSKLLKDGQTLVDLIATWSSGAVKLKLTSDLLRDRRDHALFYARADYTPLTVTGDKWSRVVAFSRRHKGETIVVLVPRLSGTGSATPTMPIGTAYWGSTTIELAAGRWRDIFEGAMHQSDGSVRVGTLLATFPFAVLRMDG